MVKPKIHLLLAIVLALSCTGLNTAAAKTDKPKPIVLKAASWGGPNYSYRMIMERAMKTIEKRTEGGITFDYYPGGALLKLPQTFEAVKNNVVSLAVISIVSERERMGILCSTVILPFTYDAEKWHEHWRDPGMYYDFAEPYWNKHNMHLLAQAKVPYGELHSRAPVRNLEDLKGMMIRSFTAVAPAVQALGAETVFIPLSELYSALQRGVVDGGLSSVADYEDKKRYEVAPHLLISHFYSACLSHAINRKVYQSLPPEWQKIVDEAFREAEQWWAGIALDQYNQRLESLKGKGVDIYTLPEEEQNRWKSALEPMWKDLEKQFPAEYPKLKPIIDELS
jgi:TRAP-type C4-dicarboxylate transport system substrate-binding protein